MQSSYNDFKHVIRAQRSFLSAQIEKSHCCVVTAGNLPKSKRENVLTTVFISFKTLHSVDIHPGMMWINLLKKNKKKKHCHHVYERRSQAKSVVCMWGKIKKKLLPEMLFLSSDD